MNDLKKILLLMAAGLLAFSRTSGADVPANHQEVLLAAEAEAAEITEIPEVDSESAFFCGDYAVSVSSHSVTPVALHTESVTYDHEGAEFGELLVKQGSYVVKGQKLATFYPDNSAAAMEEVRRELEREKDAFDIGKAARIDEIELVKANRETLANSYDIEIQDLRINQKWTDYSRYVNAEEYKIVQLEKKLAQMEKKYAEDAIYAPIDGIIDTGNAPFLREGDKAGKVTMHIFDPDSIRLVTPNIDGFYFGQKVMLEYGPTGSRESITGVVSSTSELLSEEDVSLTSGLSNYKEKDVVVIRLPGVDMHDFYKQYLERNSKLSTNLTATVPAKYVQNVLMVDKQYVYEESGRYYCMVDEDGNQRKVFFETGGSCQDAYWVLAGLEPDMNVVLK